MQGKVIYGQGQAFGVLSEILILFYFITTLLCMYINLAVNFIIDVCTKEKSYNSKKKVISLIARTID